MSYVAPFRLKWSILYTAMIPDYLKPFMLSVVIRLMGT